MKTTYSLTDLEIKVAIAQWITRNHVACNSSDVTLCVSSRGDRGEPETISATASPSPAFAPRALNDG